MGKGECIEGLGVMGRSQQPGKEHWGRAHTTAQPLPAKSRKPVSTFHAWRRAKGKKAHPARVLADKEPWSHGSRLPQHRGDEHHRLNLASQVHEHMHMSKYFFQSKRPPRALLRLKMHCTVLCVLKSLHFNLKYLEGRST